MIVGCLRRIADWLEPRTIDLSPWTPSEPPPDVPAVACRNCGWDGTRDATPLLADLLEQARRDGARRHALQEDTAHGAFPRVLR